jgi:hypothetical protein
MYLSGPYSSCFSAENRSAAARSKVIGAHGAPLGRLQLEFRPKLVKPMFREGEEDVPIRASRRLSIEGAFSALLGSTPPRSGSRGREPLQTVTWSVKVKPEKQMYSTHSVELSDPERIELYLSEEDAQPALDDRLEMSRTSEGYCASKRSSCRWAPPR